MTFLRARIRLLKIKTAAPLSFSQIILHNPAKEHCNLHLANKSVLVHRSALLPARRLWRLRPHLLDVLEHHVTMSIKGLDTRQQFPVVAA